MLLQRLATGATGVKQARYRSRHSYAHAQYIHNASVCMCGAAVACETCIMNSAEGFAL